MGGSLTEEEILTYTQQFPELNTFIEGGTYKGESTRLACKHFTHVYSFEINPELHRIAKQNAIANSLSTEPYLFGDSLILLRQLLQSPIGQCMFFLDAHQSGPETSNNGENVPLLKELAIIDELYPLHQKAVVCVDDVRLFGKYWDWAHISTDSIEKAFTRHSISQRTIVNDRFWFVLN